MSVESIYLYMSKRLDGVGEGIDRLVNISHCLFLQAAIFSLHAAPSAQNGMKWMSR